MREFGFYFDATRCTGCKTCMLACKDYYSLVADLAFRQVYEYELDGAWTRDAQGCWSVEGGTYYVSTSCQHCAEPACMKVCPTGAMHKEDDGTVCVDVARCIGCGYCHLSCPYNAPKVDEVAGHSVKCTGCHDRLVAGEDPICVAACPQRALEYGEYGELAGRKGAVCSLAPLPAEGATGPHLAIRPPHYAASSGSARGFVANRDEIV